MNSKMETIPTSRELEASREAEWEKSRKKTSSTLHKKASTIGPGGVSIGTREESHENADRVGRGDKAPTEVNPASEAAETQEKRSHSKGETDLSMGAKAERTIDRKAKTTLGRNVSSTADGMQESAARRKFVKSAKAENDKVFGK